MYGCSGRANTWCAGPCSTILTEIHHGNTIGEVAHYGEVVRDEQVGDAEAFLEVLQQVDHLRLHRQSSADTGSSQTTSCGR